jgi:hypothetical protein
LIQRHPQIAVLGLPGTIGTVFAHAPSRRTGDGCNENKFFSSIISLRNFLGRKCSMGHA